MPKKTFKFKAKNQRRCRRWKTSWQIFFSFRQPNISLGNGFFKNYGENLANPKIEFSMEIDLQENVDKSCQMYLFTRSVLDVELSNPFYVIYKIYPYPDMSHICILFFKIYETFKFRFFFSFVWFRTEISFMFCINVHDSKRIQKGSWFQFFAFKKFITKILFVNYFIFY